MTKQNKKELTVLLVIIFFLLILAPVLRPTDFTQGFLSSDDDFFVVKGKIVKSGTRYLLGGGKSTGGYKLQIQYEYNIDNRKFRSEKYSFGQSKFNSKKEAEDITNSFIVGEFVEVYVSRSDNSISVLNIGQNSNKDFLILFLINIAISFYLLYRFKTRIKNQHLRKKRKKR